MVVVVVGGGDVVEVAVLGGTGDMVTVVAGGLVVGKLVRVDVVASEVALQAALVMASSTPSKRKRRLIAST